VLGDRDDQEAVKGRHFEDDVKKVGSRSQATFEILKANLRDRIGTETDGDCDGIRELSSRSTRGTRGRGSHNYGQAGAQM
jgi:hypothetical protein